MKLSVGIEIDTGPELEMRITRMLQARIPCSATTNYLEVARDVLKEIKESCPLVLDLRTAEAQSDDRRQEALLLTVIDQLRSFQKGPHASPESSAALISAERALGALHRRRS